MSSERGRPISFVALAGLVLVLGLICWLYAPVLRFGWVMFDDDVNLYGNPHIGELTWNRFVWAWTGHDYLPRVMPLAWLAVMAIFSVGGMEPVSFHAYNLALHLMSTGLVFAVTGLVLRLAARSRGRSFDATWFSWLSLLAAAAWGLHPLRSESIAWATGWIYPTATFFALAAAWLALSRLEHGGGRRTALLAAGLAAFTASTLVYPVTLGLPAALLAFEWWLSRGVDADLRVGWRRLVRMHACFFAVAGVVLALNVWTRVWKNEFYPPSPSLVEFTVENRVAQAITTVPYYARRVTWPGETTPVRDLPPPARLRDVSVMLTAAALLAAVGWALARWRRWPGGIAFGAAYLGAAAPFSGFFDYPFQPSDRYGYFPGVVMMVTLALALGPITSRARRGFILVALTLWTGWLAAAVPRQLPKWTNSEALFGYLRATLRSPEGKTAYGVSLATHRARRGDFDEARRLLAELEAGGAEPAVLAERREWQAKMEDIARAPTFIPTPRGVVAPDAVQAYMFALRDARAGEDRGAAFRFRQTLAADPDFHDARYNFVLWLAGRGRVAEARREHEELRRRAATALSSERDEILRTLIERSAAARGAVYP